MTNITEDLHYTTYMLSTIGLTKSLKPRLTDRLNKMLYDVLFFSLPPHIDPS